MDEVADSEPTYESLVASGGVILARDDRLSFTEIERIPAPLGGTKAMLDDVRGKL